MLLVKFERLRDMLPVYIYFTLVINALIISMYSLHPILMVKITRSTYPELLIIL